MKVPENLRYTEDHEWLALESGRGKVGITDFAQDQLGDIVFVELPEVGRELKKGEAFGVVESVKSVSDLYAPVNGKVLNINTALADQPELLNQDPFGKAWLIEMAVDEAEAGSLMDAAAYEAHAGHGEH